MGGALQAASKAQAFVQPLGARDWAGVKVDGGVWGNGQGLVGDCSEVGERVGA